MKQKHRSLKNNLLRDPVEGKKECKLGKTTTEYGFLSGGAGGEGAVKTLARKYKNVTAKRNWFHGK